MKKNQLFFLHLIFWILYFTGSVFIPIFVMHVKHPQLDVTFFTVNFICFYINYFFVVPRFFDINNIYKSILGFFLSVCCFVGFRYLIEEQLLMYFFGMGNYAEGTTFGFYFYDNIFFSSTIIFISTVFSLFKLISRSEEERIQLIEEKMKAEVQALKTQINPHFIFNSLNNIYSLVYQKSEKALSALEELSQLLRYSTKDLEQDFIPLEREVGYIHSLIELEKLRLKNPELISVEVNLQNPQVKISPMILVPFVENVFKHGDFQGKGFNLIINEKNNRLEFKLMNSISNHQKDESSGIGIENVRKCLNLIYPNRHHLEIKETISEFSVHLTIEL